MIQPLVIVGTDTNVGKTMLAALLMAVTDSLYYWKPIQSGLEEETDSEVVLRLSECQKSRVIPEAYRFTQPLSPHLSSRLDGIEVSTDMLQLPNHNRMIIETAGGVLVPITGSLLQIDLLSGWNLPVVIATRSSLGTINHSLLTIRSLRSQNIDILGFVMIGEPNEENENAVAKYGEVEFLGRIPKLDEPNRTSFLSVYTDQFLPNLKSYLDVDK